MLDAGCRGHGGNPCAKAAVATKAVLKEQGMQSKIIQKRFVLEKASFMDYT